MKRSYFIQCIIIFFAQTLVAQPTTPPIWTWQRGSNTCWSPGNYGTIGVELVSNEPPARTGGVSFLDPSGNLCFFGGSIATPYGNDQKDDIWRFDRNTGNWTWIKGSQGWNLLPSYGTIGVESPGNTPGGRSGSASWLDNEGNLWIFGGDAGPGWDNWHYSDVWKFNFATNNWACMINYSSPYARSAPISWKGNNGKFYMYGGFAHISIYNDLWEFNPATLSWTNLLPAIPLGTGIAPVHVTIGVPSVTNHPGSRCGGTGWVHDGDLYFFGGTNNFFIPYMYNDVWKFSLSNRQWSWIHGSSTPNAMSIYGSQGQPSLSGVPGSRAGLKAAVLQDGNLIFFGGYGYASTATAGLLNELWKYSPATNQWTWLRENSVNEFGIYGTQGVPSTLNKPGGRSVQGFWTARDGSVWLFGGQGYAAGNLGELNDLWKLENATVVPLKILSFNAQKENGSIRLKWNATNISNGGKFFVEQSYDQATFRELTTIDAISSQQHYEALDSIVDPTKEVVFYRLKISEPGISDRFSETRAVQLKPLAISLFPNPASTTISFVLPKTSLQGTYYEIVNTGGSTLMKKLMPPAMAGTRIEVGIKQLPAGIYYLRVAGAHGTFTREFLKY